MPLLALVLLAVLAGAAPSRAAAHERWRRPLPDAAVVRTFSFDAAAPYARGRRRGIDLAGRPGARVLAACGGTVTHAGHVPGWGRGVTLRCGPLVATELGLRSELVVRGGAHVRAGTVIGRLGARGTLRLGARRAGLRHGYLDPLALLDDGPAGAPAPPPAGAPAPPPGAAPAPRSRHRAPPPRPAAPSVAAAPGRHALPWPAWAGLGLLAAGAGGGGIARRRRRHRTATGVALAQR